MGLHASGAAAVRRAAAAKKRYMTSDSPALASRQQARAAVAEIMRAGADLA